MIIDRNMSLKIVEKPSVRHVNQPVTGLYVTRLLQDQNGTLILIDTKIILGSHLQQLISGLPRCAGATLLFSHMLGSSVRPKGQNTKVDALSCLGKSKIQCPLMMDL